MKSTNQWIDFRENLWDTCFLRRSLGVSSHAPSLGIPNRHLHLFLGVTVLLELVDLWDHLHHFDDCPVTTIVPMIFPAITRYNYYKPIFSHRFSLISNFCPQISHVSSAGAQPFVALRPRDVEGQLVREELGLWHLAFLHPGGQTLMLWMFSRVCVYVYIYGMDGWIDR